MSFVFISAYFSFKTQLFSAIFCFLGLNVFTSIFYALIFRPLHGIFRFIFISSIYLNNFRNFEDRIRRKSSPSRIDIFHSQFLFSHSAFFVLLNSKREKIEFRLIRRTRCFLYRGTIYRTQLKPPNEKFMIILLGEREKKKNIEIEKKNTQFTKTVKWKIKFVNACVRWIENRLRK